MTSYEQPLANGISTDHPIPGMPFVDDQHIPLQDPRQIEALGRRPGTDMWGRCDTDDGTGEWMAFTTDPKNPAVAWVVRYHPKYGRSVLLYRNKGAAGVHHEWFVDRPLLLRLGGYWWNGETWFRPRQLIDWASEKYVRREVHSPTTITAEDLLDSRGKTAFGEVRKVMQIDPAEALEEVSEEQWRHNLALWAARRRKDPDALPLDQCVATLAAPELRTDALLSLEDVATAAEIAPSTLRAYLARDEADIPAPQVTTGGRKLWSRSVINDWIERRQRDSSNVATVLTGDPERSLPPALDALWKRLTEAIFNLFWERPADRRRWSRPHRTEQAVQKIAQETGWIAALHLDSEIPVGALAETIEHAVLFQMSSYRDRDRKTGNIGLAISTGEALGWLVRYQPSHLPQLFGAIVGRAERELRIGRDATEETLRTALMLDGGFGDPSPQLDELMNIAMPPKK